MRMRLSPPARDEPDHEFTEHVEATNHAPRTEHEDRHDLRQPGHLDLYFLAGLATPERPATRRAAILVLAHALTT